MYTCNQCGLNVYIPDEVKFCPRCGSKATGEFNESTIEQRLIEISRAMNSRLDLDFLLHGISSCACDLTNAETGSTMLYDSAREELYFKTVLGKKKDILNRLNIRSNPPSVAWWVFRKGLPAIVNDTSSDTRFSGSVDEITGFKTKNILCVPIILQLDNDMENHSFRKGGAHAPRPNVIGVIEVINKMPDTSEFTAEDQRVLSILAHQAAVAVQNAKAAGDRRNFFVNAIEVFIKAIESSGFTSPGHCMKVARNSMAIAYNLGAEQDGLHNLYYASALHDIGFLDIRCKQDYVSGNGCPESHAIIGAEMLKPVNLLAETEGIIRHHHESWDGSGYPDGLRGNEIELGARIVAVAEAYEEMAVSREFVAGNAGKLFDPEVVDAFLEIDP